MIQWMFGDLFGDVMQLTNGKTFVRSAALHEIGRSELCQRLIVHLSLVGKWDGLLHLTGEHYRCDVESTMVSHHV